jgi:hypothetical protein
MPVGKRIVVRQIHNIVKNSCELTATDLTPHPSEIRRRNHYPAWKRKVQAVLHSLKMKGKIQHFSETEEYEFNSTSFN